MSIPMQRVRKEKFTLPVLAYTVCSYIFIKNP